jgi:hypothetical protein
MRCTHSCVVLAALALLAPVASAQQPAGISVPPVVKFTGTLSGVRGAVPVTFALYVEQAGGPPLWTETQTVVVDADGRYGVTLGATRTEGLPVGLFATGEARWLGVQADGQAEQPRVLLVSVPYALKAADADAVGGKPLSAFVLAGDRTGIGPDGLTYVDARVLKNGLSGVEASPEGAGSAGFIGMFQDATTLVNSVMFQNGTSIGVGTTTPAAAFHSTATAAPGAFFDVYSNALGALPVVYRAARGTPASPSAVQTDDILGGLAVRGYGATGFSAGQGQVMFKAAENWTNTAHGTYLSMTTTPVGAPNWVERMRISPNGFVGIGTPAPTFPLDVRLPQGNTYARFSTDAGYPLFVIANQPQVGFNAYLVPGGYRYGLSGGAGYLAFNQDIVNGFTFATAAPGTTDTLAAMTRRVAITNDGKVGIGTTTPAQTLDVAGTIQASGSVIGDIVQGLTKVKGDYGYFSTSNPDYYAVLGESLGSGATRGVVGVVNSTAGVAGQFTNGAASGKVIQAAVGGTEVMSADETGIHAGPGLTGTPLAYGTFYNTGQKASGSANLTCSWNAVDSRYDCTISGEDFDWTEYVTIVTPLTAGVVARAGSSAGKLAVSFSTIASPSTPAQSDFCVVIYKP